MENNKCNCEYGCACENMNENKSGCQSSCGKKCPIRCKGLRLLISVVVFAILICLVIRFSISTYISRINPRNISVVGKSEIYVSPDIANISFSVKVFSKNNDIKKIQDETTNKINNIIQKLNELNISNKDIKTENYSISTRYEYQSCANPNEYPSCISKNVAVGVDLSSNINIKVRDLENLGKVLTILADNKIQDVSGPNFEVDNLEAKKIEAKELAIENARENAKRLAKSLKVSLGKVSSYYENTDTNNFPNPVFDVLSAKSSLGFESNPTISKGEQKIVGNVTVVYTIK